MWVHRITSTHLIWSFSFDLNIFDCWLVCLHWLYQHFSILKLVLRYVRKFSAGRILNGHTDFLPSQVWGRLCWRCRLVVHTSSYQLFLFIGLKYPSSSSIKTSIVDFWLVSLHWLDNNVLPWNLYSGVLAIFYRLHPKQTYGFSPPRYLGKVMERVPDVLLHLSSSIHWQSAR